MSFLFNFIFFYSLYLFIKHFPTVSQFFLPFSCKFCRSTFSFGFCNDPNSVLLRLLYIFPSFLHSYPVQGLMQNCSGFSLLCSFFRLGNASSDASRLLCEVLQSAVEISCREYYLSNILILITYEINAIYVYVCVSILH